MYKIGIVGDRDAVLGFMALGFSVHAVDGAEEAAKKLRELISSEEYAVVFITETYASQLGERANPAKHLPLPAIVSIPDSKGGGFGMQALRSAVERATGVDLFKDSKM